MDILQIAAKGRLRLSGECCFLNLCSYILFSSAFVYLLPSLPGPLCQNRSFSLNAAYGYYMDFRVSYSSRSFGVLLCHYSKNICLAYIFVCWTFR